MREVLLPVCEGLSVSVSVKLCISILFSRGCTEQIARERCGDEEENSEAVSVAGGPSSCGRHIHLPSPLLQSADISVLARYKLRIKMGACEAGLRRHARCSFVCCLQPSTALYHPSYRISGWILLFFKLNFLFCLCVSVQSPLHCYFHTSRLYLKSNHSICVCEKSSVVEKCKHKHKFLIHQIPRFLSLSSSCLLSPKVQCFIQ